MVVDKNGYSSNEDCLNKNLYIIKSSLKLAEENVLDGNGLKRAVSAVDSIQEYFKIGKYMER